MTNKALLQKGVKTMPTKQNDTIIQLKDKIGGLKVIEDNLFYLLNNLNESLFSNNFNEYSDKERNLVIAYCVDSNRPATTIMLDYLHELHTELTATEKLLDTLK
jgi:hypothetical protein